MISQLDTRKKFLWIHKVLVDPQEILVDVQELLVDQQEFLEPLGIQLAHNSVICLQLSTTSSNH